MTKFVFFNTSYFLSSVQNVENEKTRKKFSTARSVENVENRPSNTPIFSAFFDIRGSFPHFPQSPRWKTPRRGTIVQFAQQYQKTEIFRPSGLRILSPLFVFLSNFVCFFCLILSAKNEDFGWRTVFSTQSYLFQYFSSSERRLIASAICSTAIFSLSARSAIVRATRKIRS